MINPKGINRKKLVPFVLLILRKGVRDHEQKKETADLAGAVCRQGGSRGRAAESQAKGKDFAEPDFQADPKRQNPPPLYQSRYVGELPAEPGIAYGR